MILSRHAVVKISCRACEKAAGMSRMTGLNSKDLFEGQDLNATIDARAVYCAVMAACFEFDFDYIRKRAFWDQPLPDLIDTLFKV